MEESQRINGFKLVEIMFQNPKDNFSLTYKEDVIDALYVAMANGLVEKTIIDDIEVLFQDTEYILVPGKDVNAISLTDTISVYELLSKEYQAYSA